MRDQPLRCWGVSAAPSARGPARAQSGGRAANAFIQAPRSACLPRQFRLTNREQPFQDQLRRGQNRGREQGCQRIGGPSGQNQNTARGCEPAHPFDGTDLCKQAARFNGIGRIARP